MNMVDLYISKRTYSETGRVLGAEPEVSYQPIEFALMTNYHGNIDIRIERAAHPTITIKLPAGWVMTEKLGIVNVEMPTPATIEGQSRKFVDPLVLLTWARSGQNGVRIVKGTNPLDPDQTDAEIITRRTLSFMEA